MSKAYVSILPTKDGRVFVFGATSGIYAHAFQISDGKPLFQFSSAYEMKYNVANEDIEPDGKSHEIKVVPLDGQR